MPTNRRAWGQIAVLFGLLATTAPAWGAEPSAEQAEFFENEVRPLLAKACFRCHGPKKQESGLRLDARAALMQGGTSGPAVVPGDPQKSLLVKLVRHAGDLQMPPDRKLADAQIGTLVRWITLGAPWPGDTKGVAIRTGEITDEDRKFWSFQPVQNPRPPVVRNVAWAQSPIDRFILGRLESGGVAPAPPADRRTLLRRATFDLTGLPPTPAEVEDMLSDKSPDWYERLVERLLASPHYGERWGRHWLDVVRYADTAGETADYPVREAYRYRNYVIDAFNQDKPYDQFLREQIAGDILAQTAPPQQYADLITATGFLALSRRFGFDPENYHHLTIQDTIDTLGQSVLGLSLGCARCHHHKFDPVALPDYYGLYGIFASTRYAFPGSEQKNRPYNSVPLVPAAEAQSLRQAQDELRSKLSATIQALDTDIKATEAALKALAPTEQAGQDELKAQLASLKAQRAEEDKQRTRLAATNPFPVAYGVTEDKGQNAKVHKRGEPRTLGDEVPRRNLTILGGDPLPEGAGSGRLELAAWLTDRRNPLTARVLANRVWQHHFGQGLVATENDFGARGQRPTHPELLDWLAQRLMTSGWSIKALHREIMLSATYRQSAAGNPRLNDPDNRLLARFTRQRLDAEAIRDALLLIGGNLERGEDGPHPFPPVDRWGFTQHNPFIAVYPTNRRSIYLMTQRIRRHPFLALFDGPDANASTARRLPTTVPTQALFFMNDPFVHEQSAGFARRLLTAHSDDVERIRLAFRMALARDPAEGETQQGLRFLSQYRAQLQPAGGPGVQQDVACWAAYARTLMTRNEFMFID